MLPCPWCPATMFGSLQEFSYHMRRCHDPFKRCACGLLYFRDTWEKLQLVGRQEVPAGEGEPAYTLELRLCTCGSSIAVIR